MRYKLSSVGMVRENHAGFINGSGNELLIDNYKFIEINHGKYVIEFDY